MRFNRWVVDKIGGEVTRTASVGRPRNGARRARLEGRRTRRSTRYGRFLGLAALGSLVPGAGLWAAGRRRWGAFFLVGIGLALAAAVAVVVLVPRSRLAAVAFNRDELTVVGLALAAGAAIWLLVALTSHRALEPRGLSTGQRLGGALVVTLATSLAIAPLALGSRYAFTQRDLIGAISADDEASLTTPEIEEKTDPWADIPRVNVLLLGGDAGRGREGLRPDTQILASIDTKTGDTVMFSLPRNLQGVPFPADSPLDEYYPSGFGHSDDDPNYLLNAVYQNVPAEVPAEVFADSENPGADANKWAVEGILGVPVDYYVLVDLAGFQTIVDALGGVTLDVHRDIPIGGGENERTGGKNPITGYIEKGDNQHLDGYHALWFARSREGSDDYERMARQRCVIGAIIDEADPATLLTRYQSLAAAAKDIVRTDIPADLFPAFAELGLKVKNRPIETLSLDNKFFQSFGSSTSNPAYDTVHQLVQEALAAPPTPTPTATPGPSESASAATDTEAGGPGVATSGPSPTATPDPDEAADLSAVC
jgi:LCP family protein required for cell wall assembly